MKALLKKGEYIPKNHPKKPKKTSSVECHAFWRNDFTPLVSFLIGATRPKSNPILRALRQWLVASDCPDGTELGQAA